MANPVRYAPVASAMLMVKKKVHLIGSVVEFTLPKKSNGTDFFCKVTIMDSSSRDCGLVVQFFAKDEVQLPHIRSYGDIICLLNVLMTSYEGKKYALFNKRISSFALVGGKSCIDFVTYQSSSPLVISDSEKKLITLLRTWLIDHHFSVGVNDYLLQLKEIKMDEYCDLICKILHVSEIPEGGWIVYVWDGTDCPPANFATNLESENVYPPLQFEESPIARSVLCTFPCVGTVLRVLIGNSFGGLHLHLQPIGQWIKLRSILCKVQSGLWYAELTSASSMRQLNNENSLVKERLQEYERRLASNFKCLPSSCLSPPTSPTVTTHDCALFSTLMAVLTDSKVDSKYRCVVRVVTIFPRRPEQFIMAEYGICIRLTLEDPTARIEAHIFQDQGEKFFGGLPTAANVYPKISKLLGIGEEQGPNSRNPPWIQCCILSYCTNKTDIWGSRKFKIVDTELVG